MFSKYMSLGKVQWVGTENLKSLVLEEKCLVWEAKGIEQCGLGTLHLPVNGRCWECDWTPWWVARRFVHSWLPAILFP